MLPSATRADLDLMQPNKLHVRERMDNVIADFASKCYLHENGCVLWKSTAEKNTYGNFKINGVYQKSHRLSYHWFNGDIPDGFVVRHMCRRTTENGTDNRACVNPKHLEIGTLQDNNADQAEARKIQSAIAQKSATREAQEKLDHILLQVQELQALLQQLRTDDDSSS